MSETPRFHDPNFRPYNPGALMELTEHLLTTGSPVVSPTAPPAPTPERGYHPADHLEALQEKISEGAAAVAGLFMVFAAFGSTEKVKQRAERTQHRVNTIRIVGETLSNPRGPEEKPMQPFNATQKLGWTGIHKRTIEGGARHNPHRPVSRAERAATKRLEAKGYKRARAANMARWLLKDPHEASATAAQHQLTAAESRREHGINRKADRLQRKAHRAARQFNRITASQDFRGQLALTRLAVMQQRLASPPRESVVKKAVQKTRQAGVKAAQATLKTLTQPERRSQRRADRIHLDNVAHNRVEHGPRDIDGYTWKHDGHEFDVVRNTYSGQFEIGEWDGSRLVSRTMVDPDDPDDLLNQVRARGGSL